MSPPLLLRSLILTLLFPALLSTPTRFVQDTNHDPTLANLEPTTIILQHFGSTSSQAGTMNVIFQLNVLPLLHSVEGHHRAIRDYADRWNWPSTHIDYAHALPSIFNDTLTAYTGMEQLLRATQLTLQDVAPGFAGYDTRANQPHAFPSYGGFPLQRGKRALQFVGLAVQTLFSFLDFYQTSRLALAVTAQGKQIDNLYVIAEQQAERITRLDYDIQNLTRRHEQLQRDLNSATTTLLRAALISTARQTDQAATQNIHDVFTSLDKHRLSRKLIDGDRLPEFWNQLTRQAAASGYELLISRYSHLFQIETSHVTNANGTTFIIVHIPITKTASVLQLHRYVPLPMPITDDSWIQLRPEHDVIAISDTGAFRTMTSESLGQCQRQASVYTCPDANVQFYSDALSILNPASACIWHLYHASYDEAQLSCPKDIFPPFDAAYQLRAGTFIVYSTKPRSAEVYCPNTTPNRLPLSFPRSPVFLEPGCEATVQQGTHNILTITAALSIDAEVSYTPSQWPGRPTDLLNGLNITAYSLARDQLRRDMPTDLALAHSLVNELVDTDRFSSSVNDIRRLRQDFENGGMADTPTRASELAWLVTNTILSFTAFVAIYLAIRWTVRNAPRIVQEAGLAALPRAAAAAAATTASNLAGQAKTFFRRTPTPIQAYPELPTEDGPTEYLSIAELEEQRRRSLRHHARSIEAARANINQLHAMADNIPLAALNAGDRVQHPGPDALPRQDVQQPGA